MGKLILLVALAILPGMSPLAVDLQQDKDPYGMRSWILVLLRRGPEYSKVEGEERKKIFNGHMDNMSALAKKGVLRLAGPFGVDKAAPKNALAGLFLYDVKTRKEALALCAKDPTIASKVFTVEALQWYGPSDITYRGDTARKPATKGKADVHKGSRSKK